MADVLNRSTKVFVQSGSSPDFPTAQWIHNPLVGATPMRDWIGSAVRREPKYVNIVLDVVTEMTDIEKDAVDAAEAAVSLADRREVARTRNVESSDQGIEFNALVELFNKRDNFLVNRIVELQDALLAAKAATGGAQNTRDALPASYLATSTRAKADAIADYDADVAAGNQDV